MGGAVSRLAEDADARKVAEVASKSDLFQVGELSAPELIVAFMYNIGNFAQRAI